MCISENCRSHLLLIGDDPVETGAFGKIQGLIGQFQQIRGCRQLVGLQGGYPDTHRHRPLAPLILEQMPFDQGTEFLGNRPGIVQAGIGEDNNEFLATDSVGQIARPTFSFTRTPMVFKT
jgi:hypothetical protein